MNKLFGTLCVSTMAATAFFSPLSADVNTNIAAKSQDILPVVPRTLHASLNKFCEHAPAWMKEIDISSSSKNFGKSQTSVSVLHPFATRGANNESVWAVQGNLTHDRVDNDFNLGLVYRLMSDDATWIYGLNTFCDRSSRMGHSRLSLGLELTGQYLSFSTNYYTTVTALQVDNSDHEKGLDGYDVSLSAPVPYNPWLRVYGNHQRWESKSGLSANRRVNTLSVHACITPKIHFEAGTIDDNASRASSFAHVTFNLGHMVRGVEESLLSIRSNSPAFTPRDLSNQMDQKVDRQNTILVESLVY